MAEVRICDKCEAIIRPRRPEDVSLVMLKIPRKYRDQHDGEFEKRTLYSYDLCDKCAKELYKLISGDDPDKVII